MSSLALNDLTGVLQDSAIEVQLEGNNTSMDASGLKDDWSGGSDSLYGDLIGKPLQIVSIDVGKVLSNLNSGPGQ